MSHLTTALLCLCLCPAVARAQLNYDVSTGSKSISDLDVNTGSNGGTATSKMGFTPGMPIPETGARQQPAENGGGRQNGKGRDGLILYDRLEDPLHGGGGGDSGEAEADAPQDVPDQYIVVKGDTLWSICARFFNNPWYWPKLWAMNDIITNPHWIYPGDLLNLRPPGEQKSKAAPKPRPQPESALQRSRIVREGPALPSGLVLRQNGFVEPTELEAAGKIVGSKEEKLMLAAPDEVYIEMNRKAPLKIGQRYTIYTVTRAVRRPYGNRELLGNVVEIQGEVQVRQVTSGGIARAIIREAVAPVERGFRVGPLRRTFQQVDPQKSTVNGEGVIVESLLPTSVLSSETLLFMDIGKQAGITVGNRVLVVRRGDGSSKIMSLAPVDDKRYPREVVAEIIILDARDRVSAGLITRSTKEVHLGDRVEARKGY